VQVRGREEMDRVTLARGVRGLCAGEMLVHERLLW
jgi:hypothetical protein